HENTLADCAADDSCYPVQIENTFGFSIGGPIKKDKLFVFGSSQWDRFRSTNNGNTLLAPTADGVAALQALNSAHANFLIAAFNGLTATNATRPIALGSNGGADRGIINFGPVQRSGIAEVQNDRQWDVRLDFNATDKDTLF